MFTSAKTTTQVIRPDHGRCVALRALFGCTLLFHAATAAAQAQGSVIGTVTDSAGIPLLGVEIAVDGTPTHAYTDQQGVFRLGGVQYGPRTLSARRLGFAPTQVSVEVVQSGEAAVQLRMRALVSILPPVVIRPGRMNYTGRLAGYYERLEKKSNGYFITRDQIDHENPRMLGQLLAHVPGVMTVRARGGITGIRLRGRSCWPLVWIDGTPMPSGEVDLDSFSPTTIHGIELYLGSTTAPARYNFTRDVSSCGTILIWSRGPDTDPINFTPTPSVDLEALVAGLSVFNADQVDRRARLDTTRLLKLSFPPPLFAAGIHGLVVAEFIVDTTGKVEDGTVGIVSSTAPLFTDAVRVALESASYVPAIKNGHPVRQLVQQPFEFSVDRQARAR
jgi:TonB family protein